MRYLYWKFIMNEALDTNWIEDFEKKEEQYNEFYHEEVTTIQGFFLYINADNVLERIKEETIKLDEVGVLGKEQLIGQIKNNEKDENIKYNLKGVLKYNINLDPKDVASFLGDEHGDNRLQNIEYVSDIYFNKTIKLFQDLNTIFFIFTEQSKKLKHSNTRKLAFKSQYRKTKRKRA